MFEVFFALLLLSPIAVFSYLYFSRLAFTWTTSERKRMLEEELHLFALIEILTAWDTQILLKGNKGRELARKLSSGFWHDLKAISRRRSVGFRAVALAAALVAALVLMWVKWTVRWYHPRDVYLLAGLELALFRSLQ